MRALRGERGEFSLTGLLVASVIFLVVLGATLTTFAAFDRRSREEAERIDVEDRTRVAIDRLARELRNLAQPQADGRPTVERAEGYDLIFKTVSATVAPTPANPASIVRVRYCLDASDFDNAKLWYETQPWAAGSGAPTDTGCPGAAWPARTLIADWITNRAGGRGRPLFVYNSTILSAISSVHVDLFVDANATHPPKETRLSTGVFLRNQNQPPTARFTATPSGTSIKLDGSPSADPEGEPLRFQFHDLSSGTAVAIPACASAVCTWTPSGGPGSYSIRLTVTDAGGIAIDSATQQVTI